MKCIGKAGPSAEITLGFMEDTAVDQNEVTFCSKKD